MSLTLADALTSLAYRLGEDSSPSDATEKAKRVRFIVQGYRNLLSRKPFWFTEESTTFNSVANQEAYTTTDGFPADYRDMVELRVDNKLYTFIPQPQIFGMYDSTMNLFNYEDLVNNKHWYIYDNTLYIKPTPSANGTNNISVKYFKWPTMPSGDSDTFLIPDMFVEGLVAFAYARISQQDDARGDAADGMSEYEEMVKQLIAEDNRRKFYNKSTRVIAPDYWVE